MFDGGMLREDLSEVGLFNRVRLVNDCLRSHTLQASCSLKTARCYINDIKSVFVDTCVSTVL